MLFQPNFILPWRRFIQRFLILSVLFPAESSFAQINDSFSDGDFSVDPSWQGHADRFIVNADEQLQLNGISATDTAFLSTASTVHSTTEWSFWLKLGFSPSTSNYVKIYLCADQANLRAPLNGYYIRIGEAGGADGIDLYRQSGTASTLLIGGTEAVISRSNMPLRVRVLRDSLGTWSLFSDTTGGRVFIPEGSAADPSPPPSGFAGIVCRYTSSNRQKYYFDEFLVQPYIPDTTPPSPDSVETTGDRSLRVLFSEPPDSTTASDTRNYLAGNGIGRPLSAGPDPQNSSGILLTFATAFPDGVSTALSISGIADLQGNTMGTPVTLPFVYYAPVRARTGDILINEIFPDPSPSLGLPEAEFIELHNTTLRPFSIDGWSLSDGSTSARLPAQVIPPGGFLIVCPLGEAASFAPYGSVLGVSSFPSLNNAADNITLLDDSGKVLDRLSYSDSWYGNSDKAGGGWTLERIDPGFPCGGALNWIASSAAAGGTPGSRNSKAGIVKDITAPELAEATALHDTAVMLLFSEPPDSVSAGVSSAYSISGGIGAPQRASVSGAAVTLTLGKPLQLRTVYEITVSSSVTDCAGNSIVGNKVLTGLREPADPGDLVINEILFNPLPFGSDYVELYNRSDKIIDLSGIRVGNITESVNPGKVPCLFPRSYAVLASDTGALQKKPGCMDAGSILDTDLPSFPDDKGTVALLDSSGKEIDRFDYSESFHFGLLQSFEGVSLERLSPDRLSQDSTNWHSASGSSGYGTPGCRNSQFSGQQEHAEAFVLEPWLFSPDNDGRDDNLNISYNFNTPGMLVSITVYDLEGIAVKRICRNELLGSNGALSWDGLKEDGSKASIGIYIVHIESLEPSGRTSSFRKSCVLGGRL
jgi:hypothetical protein